MTGRTIVGLAIVGSVIAACATGVARSDFTIVVETLEAPDTIARSDSLPVRLTGLVGETDCFSVLRVDVTRADSAAVLRAIGRYELRGERCDPALVVLDRTVVLEPPFEPGEFTVVVQRGLVESLEHTVVVIQGE